MSKWTLNRLLTNVQAPQAEQDNSLYSSSTSEGLGTHHFLWPATSSPCLGPWVGIGVWQPLQEHDRLRPSVRCLLVRRRS